jgi:Arc/MetJ-type ribon-helix-helix transcriptional regulator
MMRRTNIYLNDDQLVFLRNMAMQENSTVAELVRRAVDSWLADKLNQRDRWGEQLDGVVARLRSRLPADVPEDEIEADIAAAMDEVKAARARRR